MSNTNKILETRKRVNYYWDLKGKNELGLTQQKAAKILGISQPAFSYYLKGNNPSYKAKGEEQPYGTDFLRKFAGMLGIKPSDLDPELVDMDIIVAGNKAVRIPVTLTLSGRTMIKQYLTVKLNLATGDNLFAIACDVEGHNYIRLGQFAICQTDQQIHLEDMVVLVRENPDDSHNTKVYYGELRQSGEDWTVSYLMDGRPHNEKILSGDKLFYCSGIQNPEKQNKTAFKMP